MWVNISSFLLSCIYNWAFLTSTLFKYSFIQILSNQAMIIWYPLTLYSIISERPCTICWWLFRFWRYVWCSPYITRHKASLAGGSEQISEFPRYLKIWYLAISTDDDISDSVTYNETANDSITFKFSSASGNVGRLLYSRNVSETTESFSHAPQNSTFTTW